MTTGSDRASASGWDSVVRASLLALRPSGPKGSLILRLEHEAELQDLEGSATEAIVEILSDKNHPARELLLVQFATWDADGSPTWTSTPPNTRERREHIYRLLKLDRWSEQFEHHLPPKLNVDHATVISGADDGGWYSEAFVVDREFYWPSFREHLKKKGWDGTSLQLLHQSSSRVLEHLAPPHSPIASPRRGLVVGYVQSGKTTHFTAVTAKAIDAGFRLVIVLAGTIDLLRSQTQRRLDMELVGRENILKDQADELEGREYEHDTAWDRFVSFGFRPREQGHPDIKRLTNSRGDFRSVGASFSALQFDEVDPKTGKAWHPDNIKRSNVRLIVVKKNVGRLNQLIHQIKVAKDIREDLPTLIIDDESDQASVNTRAKVAVDGHRTKINGAIVKLLAILPRAHYVGYTATPFANVFVDPNDAADIFPKDFIISLDRPIEYMGVSDFHDIVPPAAGSMGNREAHVRQFDASEREASMQKALDAFVVSGAIKLFRDARGVAIDVQHHTMLIHETVGNADQASRKRGVADMWARAGYGSPGAGMRRLETALTAEFGRVSLAKGAELPFPKSFVELRPYLAQTIAKVESDGGPVLMVNGTLEADDPQFDMKSVWKVLVGGAKLSRGYTVEGLTTTVFTRQTKQQDSLLQMGRWFGFRRGYKDLVRLFIERSDDDEFDLYSAFEGICRDEESFRAQLKQYSHTLKPAQVPALVFNSYPKLRPTAKNKMFNAQLVSAGFEGWKESARRSLEDSAVRINWTLLEELVEAHKGEQVDAVTSVGLAFRCKSKAIMQFLNGLQWHPDQGWLPERRFLGTDPLAVKQWLVVFPLLKDRELSLGQLRVSLFRREVDAGGDFGAFSDKAHRPPLEAYAEHENAGILAVYPTQPKSGNRLRRPVVGFAVYHPRIVGGKIPVAFSVRNQQQTDSVVVAAKS